jgi:hypothetical protein
MPDTTKPSPETAKPVSNKPATARETLKVIQSKLSRAMGISVLYRFLSDLLSLRDKILVIDAENKLID